MSISSVLAGKVASSLKLATWSTLAKAFVQLTAFPTFQQYFTQSNAALEIFRVIFAFCGTLVAPNVEIKREIPSSANVQNTNWMHVFKALVWTIGQVI